MDIAAFRSLLTNTVGTVLDDSSYHQTGESIFLMEGDFIVGAVRVMDKYSHTCQEVNYWLCAGHGCVEIEGIRDGICSENHRVYAFRIPWASVGSLTKKTLVYDPMSWDSRNYEVAVIKYGSSTASKVARSMGRALSDLKEVFRRLAGFTREHALEKIEATNGDVWIGKAYIRSYRNSIGVG